VRFNHESARMDTRLRASLRRASTHRTDNNAEKETVRIMKITQNVITVAAVPPFVGRLCQPRRPSGFTEWSRWAPNDMDGRAEGRAKRERAGQTPYNRIGPAAIAICFLICATAFAQNADSIADREVQRRQAGIPEGEAALARGKSGERMTKRRKAFAKAASFWPKRGSRRAITRAPKRS